MPIGELMKKRKNEKASSSVPKKKVIYTEQFPNRPDINFGFGFFKSVQQNAGKARARMAKEKTKISPIPSFTPRKDEATSSTKKAKK